MNEILFILYGILFIELFVPIFIYFWDRYMEARPKKSSGSYCEKLVRRLSPLLPYFWTK